jgi:PIN domain nuclease of toxin-antitoxin system
LEPARRILLDTHIVLWLAFESDKLSKPANEVIRAARTQGGLAIAAVTLLELAWLAENGRVETRFSVESFVRLCASKMTVLPITPEIAARAISFPDPYPRDPQDRSIGPTALVEGLQLVTHDKQIKKSGMIPVIW